jgi:hypothetical protein
MIRRGFFQNCIHQVLARDMIPQSIDQFDKNGAFLLKVESVPDSFLPF